MEDLSPLPADLPHTGFSERTARLARTMLVAGRHAGPVGVRRVVRRPKPGASLASAARRTFEDLGATYVSFGQFVASAPAIVGHDVAREFRSCLDRGPAIKPASLYALVEKELGRPVNEIFSSFDERLLAAASLAV